MNKKRSSLENVVKLEIYDLRKASVTAPKFEEKEKKDIPPDAPFRPFARPGKDKIKI